MPLKSDVTSEQRTNHFMSLMVNGRVKPGTWSKEENHIEYAKWLGEKMGYRTMDDWYQISQKDIRNNYGGGLLSQKYGGSALMFLRGVFPETEWLPWKFSMAPCGFWNDKENHIKYANWLGKKLGYNNRNDWYQISKKHICNNYGGGLLSHKYDNSPLMFLRGVFPETEWLPWKFNMTSVGYWGDVENHKIYADWLGKTLGYQTMDDWYQINAKIIHLNYGCGLLSHKYRDSPLMFMKGVFPDTEWLPWKFDMTPQGYWRDKANHIEYANWLGNTLGYQTMDDWYQINTRIIHDNYGGGLLASRYRDSFKLFVISVYPAYEWDLSKFKQQYSAGQIEWLEYMILSVPDIVHAVNDGEYSIPNSRYFADGYSDSKNLILEYHGDFWHGNPKVFNQEEMNTATKTTFGELYQKTIEKQRFCEESGYEYLSIWESEWIRGKSSVIKLQRKIKEKIHSPSKPSWYASKTKRTWKC